MERAADPPERPLGFYLTPSSFPADRAQLVGDARRAHAPESVVRLLRQLPDRAEPYADLSDLSRELDDLLQPYVAS